MLVIVLLWRMRRLVYRALLAGGVVAALASLAPNEKQPAHPRASGAARPGDCRGHDGLPDRRCTPGAVRADLSLQAICRYDYSRTVRPPEGYTEPLKLGQMRAYHLPGAPSAYEEDHLVALSIGGAPRDPANLWPEPRNGPYDAREKDQLETWVARTACSGRMPLAELQRDMAEDWTVLFRAAGGEHVLRAYRPGG